MLATKPPTASAELHELLEVFSHGDLASAMGKRTESISRMKKGAHMRRSTERLIDDFWYATHLAYRQFGQQEAVRFFVLSRQPELGGRTPAELITAGEVERVIELVQRNEDGPQEAHMPTTKDTTEQRPAAATRIAAMADRKPSRLRDQMGVRRPISAIAQERDGRYELQSGEAPAPTPTRTTTTGLLYSKPAF